MYLSVIALDHSSKFTFQSHSWLIKRSCVYFFLLHLLQQLIFSEHSDCYIFFLITNHSLFQASSWWRWRFRMATTIENYLPFPHCKSRSLTFLSSLRKERFPPPDQGCWVETSNYLEKTLTAIQGEAWTQRSREEITIFYSTSQSLDYLGLNIILDEILLAQNQPIAQSSLRGLVSPQDLLQKDLLRTNNIFSLKPAVGKPII